MKYNERFEVFAATLDYQPMETFPWVEDDELWCAPTGVVVRYGDGKYDLLGIEPSGYRSSGCSCCSEPYNRELPGNPTGWAWAF